MPKSSHSFSCEVRFITTFLLSHLLLKVFHRQLPPSPLSVVFSFLTATLVTSVHCKCTKCDEQLLSLSSRCIFSFLFFFIIAFFFFFFFFSFSCLFPSFLLPLLSSSSSSLTASSCANSRPHVLFCIQASFFYLLFSLSLSLSLSRSARHNMHVIMVTITTCILLSPSPSFIFHW